MEYNYEKKIMKQTEKNDSNNMISTFGELKNSGYTPKSIKDELID